MEVGGERPQTTSTGFRRALQILGDRAGRLTPAVIICKLRAVMRPFLSCLLLPALALLSLPPAKVFAADATTRPPLPFRVSRPAYPDELAPYRIRGEVRLAFDLDAQGYVSNIEVVYATHPAFIGPALKVAQNWRYRAALQDGKPVPTRWQETVFSDVISKGAEPFSFPAKASEDLPAEYAYDLPPSIETLAQVVYPYESLIEGREGSAEVAFAVDTEGIPREITVRKSSRPEFGHALAAAMAHWRFRPAIKDGKPSFALLSRAQHFTVNTEDALVGPSIRRLRDILRSSKEDIVEYNLLDIPPVPVVRIPPMYPEKFIGRPGNAEIEFIIDREGQAQLPKIVSASAPEFGAAAAAAVAQWKFEPPLRNGQPVDARVRVPLVFNVGKTGDAPEAANGAPGEAPGAAAEVPVVP